MFQKNKDISNVILCLYTVLQRCANGKINKYRLYLQWCLFFTGCSFLVVTCHKCSPRWHSSSDVFCPRLVVSCIYIYLQLFHIHFIFIFHQLIFKTLSCNPPHQCIFIKKYYLPQICNPPRSQPETSQKLIQKLVQKLVSSFTGKSLVSANHGLWSSAILQLENLSPVLYGAARLGTNHSGPIFLSMSLDFDCSLDIHTRISQLASCYPCDYRPSSIPEQTSIVPELASSVNHS